jgi:hypothetical protein
VEYAGADGFSIAVDGNAAPTFDHLTVREGNGTGIQYNGTRGGTLVDSAITGVGGIGVEITGNGCPSIQRTTIANAGSYGLSIGHISCDPAPAGITVTNSGAGNRIRQGGGTLTSGQSYRLRNLGYDYDVTGTIAINGGATLDVDSGLTVRMAGGTSIEVRGTFNSNGTAGAPVRFTTANASPAPGQWNEILFFNSSAGNLAHTTVEYAGAAGDALRVENNAAPTLDHLTIRNNSGNGLHLVGSYTGASRSITDSNIFGNATGLRNDSTAAYTAEGNWWGNASGPFHATLNASGTGNAVVGNVDFNPWATVPIP